MDMITDATAVAQHEAIRSSHAAVNARRDQWPRRRPQR
jgi:hypothetical protein